MTMRALLLGIIGVLLVSSSALAAPVDGKWTGMLDTPMGPVNVGFNFKADGAVLTGSTMAPDGTELPIKNGKVDGDKIAFTVEVDFGGMALTLDYTGVVSADQIKMTLSVMGMPFDFILKKTE
jgi:hypothetical protein